MILEAAILNVRPGESVQFEQAFAQVRSIIFGMPGYICHELHRCIEINNKNLLLVHWRRLEDHTEGFRNSAEYQEWKHFLHPFSEPFPTVEHAEGV